MSFPFFKQLNAMDCGPTCLRMIARFYGKHYRTEAIREKTGFNKEGVSLLGISEAAESMGFRTRGVQLTYDRLQLVPLPAILHWDQKHFVVLISINKRHAKVADPDNGIVQYKQDEMLHHWGSTIDMNGRQAGTALLLEPTPLFYDNEGPKGEHGLRWKAITQYLAANKRHVWQVFIALLTNAILQFILPFLAQSMVDTGIGTRNLQYVTIVLIAQLMVTFSSTVVNFIRTRLQLKISNSVSISILSDFWIKLSRLPLSYFDARHTGDTLQRLEDNNKIQSFLTGQSLSILFSAITFLTYSVILALYNIQLFIIFLAGSLLYFCWIRIFLRIRRKINYEYFHVASREKNAALEIVQGMQEIRINNAEQLKRWEWENIQAKLFNLNTKVLNWTQYQSAGAIFINQGKDILLSFFVAQLVISGQITFGAMLAVQYIIGQMSAPVQQFVDLSQSLQDARISMERLNEVHDIDDEEPADKPLLNELPSAKNIEISNLSFAYPGSHDEPVLKNISFTVPEGQVTAIVGGSGSGKTTLLKLLLKIYTGYQGDIRIGENHFKGISPSFWRRHCGTVFQDSYIFNDTIGRNIAVGEEYIDYQRLLQSARIANILPFIESLPNGFNSKLGSEGTGLSQGQRQRLLIARAVYKDPAFLFFDEATNALDANNEKIIIRNLQQFFKGRTVLVVAHRLSTVKDADKIIVMDSGKVVEEGTHSQLTSMKGHYYELVKNQLELNI